MKLFIRLEAPFEWVRLNGKQVEAFGEVANLSDYPLSDETDVIGIVPGEWVTCHQVDLPAKSRKQFNAALPYALEEAISEDVENMHFVSPSWKAGESTAVMVVAKSKMKQWQALANENRLPVDQLLPDYAILPFHDSAECSVALSNDQIVANREDGSGVSIDPDFLDVWMMDVPMASTIAVNDKDLTERLISEHPDRDFRHWPFGNKLAHWLEYAQVPDLDLWVDKFRPSVGPRFWRLYSLPALVLGLSILSVLIYDTYRYLSLHAEINAIHRESAEILDANFPDIGPVEPGRERTFMERGIANLGGVGRAQSMQAMLADTAQVLRRQNVTISNLVFRDKQLVITCQLSDFSQVDRLTRQLNARPRLSATLQSSANDDGTIVASYSVTQS